MARFFVNRPIVAIVISIVTVLLGLVAMSGLPIQPKQCWATVTAGSLQASGGLGAVPNVHTRIVHPVHQ